MDKKKLSIVLAAVLALMGVVLARNYISQTEKRFVKEEKKAYVLTASTSIPAGTTIDETMVKLEPVPEKYVQPKAIVATTSPALGKRAVVDILPGEQIMMTKLTIAVKDAGLAMLTPQGKRAMTITLPFLSAVGGKVKRGDWVDVVGTFPYNAQVDGKTVTELVSVTLFQNVLVLSVEGGAAPERGKAASAPTDLIITLALSPREIALLTYAMEQGRLRLVLRPLLETSVEPVPPVEVTTLWQYVFSNLGQEFVNTKAEKPPIIKQEKQEEEKPAPAPPAPTLEVYRGTEKSNMVIK